MWIAAVVAESATTNIIGTVDVICSEQPLDDHPDTACRAYAHVTRIGTTSVSVHVEVDAERDPAKLNEVTVTEADLNHVAIDAKCKPRTLAG